jgi:rare lipoprotein A
LFKNGEVMKYNSKSFSWNLFFILVTFAFCNLFSISSASAAGNINSKYKRQPFKITPQISKKSKLNSKQPRNKISNKNIKNIINLDRQSRSKLSNNERMIPLPNQLEIAQSFRGQSFTGEASWYGPGFNGRTTANGETFDQNALTAAHPSLPFGTRVEVTNINNGESVVVRINDRGPYAEGRIIDLSTAAAQDIGVVESGVAPVEVSVLGE